MAYVKKLFEENFLEYASYVIKDRAIPHLDDGLKPVQRRILHSLFEMDDGKFHKVANVVGHCMKYHPHGDQSIYSALVVLANKDLFIEKQGNFGNIYTGDEASAAGTLNAASCPLPRRSYTTRRSPSSRIPTTAGTRSGGVPREDPRCPHPGGRGNRGRYVNEDPTP
jgi:topoisomerase-4 subunit A